MLFTDLSPTLLAPIFTLLGVLVASLVQSLAFRRQISGEERKVRLSILSVFAAKLEDRRLETHAEICCILSDALRSSHGSWSVCSRIC